MILNITHDLESLNLKRGEYLTIYMFASKDKIVQVELRVLPNGKPEIFLTKDNLNIVKDFDNYEPMVTDSK